MSDKNAPITPRELLRQAILGMFMAENLRQQAQQARTQPGGVIFGLNAAGVQVPMTPGDVDKMAEEIEGKAWDSFARAVNAAFNPGPVIIQDYPG